MVSMVKRITIEQVKNVLDWSIQNLERCCVVVDDSGVKLFYYKDELIGKFDDKNNVGELTYSSKCMDALRFKSYLN